MKTKKSLLLLSAFLMVFGNKGISDSEYKEYKAYINGYNEYEFRPENEITRAEAVAMYIRLKYGDIKSKSEKNYYMDIDSKSWYKNYIDYATEKKIIKGYPDKSFRPDDSISRAEFAQLLFSTMKNSNTSSKFKDVSDNHWAKPAIDKLYEEKIIEGYGNGIFKPDNKIKRVEAVKMLNRLEGRFTNEASLKDYDIKNLKKFDDVKKEHWGYYEILDASNTHYSNEENQWKVKEKEEDIIKPDEGKKPSDTEKPDKEEKPSDTVKPDKEEKPGDTVKPDEGKKPDDTVKPDEGKKPDDEEKLNDTEKPVIEGVEDRTVQIGEEFNSLSGVKAIDNLDGDISDKIKVEGEVDTNKPGEYVLKYTVSDSSGNTTIVERTIIVKDTEKPVIEGVEDRTVQVGEEFNSLSGVKAIDNLDGDISDKIKVEGEVDIYKPGEYVLKYTVSDSSGNTTTVERIIFVEDKVSPKIEIMDLYGENIIEVGGVFNSLSGVLAYDNADGNITDKIVVEGEVDTNTPGKYILKYSVSDSSGNTTTVERVIVVCKSYSHEVYNIVNRIREEEGLYKLNWNDELAEAANIRAKEIVEKFSHERPDGTKYTSACKYAFAENIAKNWSTDPNGVVDQWMNSKGHRENILRNADSIDDIGVGYYINEDGRVYWVQLFGTTKYTNEGIN